MDQGQQQIEKVVELFAPSLRAAARTVAAYVPVADLTERQAFDVIAGVLAFDQDAERLEFLPPVPISPQDDVRAVLLDEWMSPWAAEVRTELFGSAEPPCAGLKEAAERIRAEYAQPQHDEGYVRQLQEEMFGLLFDFQQALGELEERGLWTQVGQFNVHEPRLQFIDANGCVEALGVERCDLLSRLSSASEEMAGVSGWHPAQATAYILTGQRQFAPHVSVLVRTTLLPQQHGQPTPLARKEARLVIRASDFSYEELRAIWTQLRRRGMTEKKPLSERHARVWMFVHEREETMTMESIRAEWNATNPEETYSERGLYKACARAKKKGGIASTRRKTPAGGA